MLELRRWLRLSGALLCFCAAAAASAADWRFAVRFAAEVRPTPFTGRVYLFFSQRAAEPRLGPNWFQPEPFVALDVQEWPPGEMLELSARTPGLLSFPQPLAEIPLGGLRVQAVARFNDWERTIGSGPGNGFSAAAELPAKAPDAPTPLVIDAVVAPPVFAENEWTRLCEVRSALLSEFHRRDVFVRAAVSLPPGYAEQPDRRYPVIFSIPGFGGTHFAGRRPEPVREQNPGGVEFVRVTLDPSCPWGHHVFADSATNGPWGRALVTEWLPEFERRFRVVAAPGGRLLTGHSSGGWSSLWLQITHPDVFGGVWSTAPDPVDFRDFSRVNIYRAGENAFRTPAGERRPIARRGADQVLIWYDDFDRMETVLGHGGQFRSFEAVFSPRGADGTPAPLWNRQSGSVDPAVAQAWERYDIRLVLERHWTTLGPRLAGKLHVFMGDQDTFYLDGAARLLQESLQTLGSDAVVELHPGKDHGTLLTPELRDRLRREMAETYLRSSASR